MYYDGEENLKNLKKGQKLKRKILKGTCNIIFIITECFNFRIKNEKDTENKLLKLEIERYIWEMLVLLILLIAKNSLKNVQEENIR